MRLGAKQHIYPRHSRHQSHSMEPNWISAQPQLLSPSCALNEGLHSLVLPFIRSLSLIGTFQPFVRVSDRRRKIYVYVSSLIPWIAHLSTPERVRFLDSSGVN
jgi:hypothetical protein